MEKAQMEKDIGGVSRQCDWVGVSVPLRHSRPTRLYIRGQQSASNSSFQQLQQMIVMYMYMTSKRITVIILLYYRKLHGRPQDFFQGWEN